MSKLSQLKQEAFQAGKDREWQKAISVYEQLLEADKKNPTVINELGDICLKAGETQRAVRNFLNAAAMYRKNGLLNNAVAIYKKILRHDQNNLNAHWYLAETRAGQGLKAEGERHGLIFLESNQEVAGDIKEIFLKRCTTLFELYPDSEKILDRLVQVFRMWEMTLEASRAQALLACMQFDRGEQDAAQAAMAAVLSKSPSVANYPEYAQWHRRLNPQDASGVPGAFADFGALTLDGASVASAPPQDAATPAREDTLPAGAETPASDADDAPRASAETSFADVDLGDIPLPRTGHSPRSGRRPAADLAVQKDEEGCISIDPVDQDSLPDAVSEIMGNGGEPSEAGIPEETVDLLAQILAESGNELLGIESEQLQTITEEIGVRMGGQDAESADRLYEMGMVYLEMGMFDQACTSFESAARDSEFAARAYEMWSMTLQRARRFDDAAGVLEKGLQAGHLKDGEKLGLLYHLGQAHEQAGRLDQAAECFERIKAADPGYLDVDRRLSKITAGL